MSLLLLNMSHTICCLCIQCNEVFETSAKRARTVRSMLCNEICCILYTEKCVYKTHARSHLFIYMYKCTHVSKTTVMNTSLQNLVQNIDLTSLNKIWNKKRNFFFLTSLAWYVIYCNATSTYDWLNRILLKFFNLLLSIRLLDDIYWVVKFHKICKYTYCEIAWVSCVNWWAPSNYESIGKLWKTQIYGRFNAKKSKIKTMPRHCLYGRSDPSAEIVCIRTNRTCE